MARSYEMTWDARHKRWKKRHELKWYAVSCRNLGTARSKEASWKAANDWWAAKLREIESTPQPTPENGTIEACVAAWVRLLASLASSGQLSVSRYDGYRREIEGFVKWIGADAPPSSIGEAAIEGYFVHLNGMVADGKLSLATAHGRMIAMKTFVSRLAEMRVVAMPANLRSKRIAFSQPPLKIETYTVEEVRAFLSACDEFSETLKLYILLMLNAGFTQADVADLRPDEIDWKLGATKRARSKTADRGGPVVTHRLWPETMTLLRRHAARSGERAFLSREGNPLVHRWIEGGRMRKYDLIRTSWMNLARKMGKPRHRLSMKHLRKTSASILAEHAVYKYYCRHFLSHSPRSVTDRSYVVPSEAEFAKALRWLRGRILGKAR